MKKLLALTAVAALAASALPAEITFGSWGRALWVTAANAYDKDDDSNQIVSDVHQSWGGTSAPRTALSVHGSSDNVGFDLDIFVNGTSNDLPGDNALIWVKPIEQVKISVGKHDQNVLRGDGCFGLWNWDRIGNVYGQEGWTFTDYLDVNGVDVIANPVEGLTLAVGIPLELNHDANWSDVGNKVTTTSDDVKKDGAFTLSGIYAHGAAYVAAYNIKGVGTIKAALKTLPKAGDDSQTEIGAAFDLTAVENLFVSVGAKINTLKEANCQKVNAYARYGVNEQLAIHALVGTNFNGKDTKENKADGELGFLVGAGVDYNLDGGIGLFADVRYANGILYSGTSADNSDNLTFGLGVTKGYSNGLIGIAFEGSTNNGGRYELKPNDDGVYDKFSWEIPVRFEYWF
ncbi:MAG: hypothetical protein IJ727_09745 [Treponema sp.]|nr:hypothetical protein [Treponema sp.]